MMAIANASDALDNVASAIKSGSSTELSKAISNNVEICILDDEGVYSKDQAMALLKSFFAKNKPSGFKILHRGVSKEGSSYGIGLLSTSNGDYRTYFYVKQKGDSYSIIELRFEEE